MTIAIVHSIENSLCAIVLLIIASEDNSMFSIF